MRSTPWPKLILRTVKVPWGPFLHGDDHALEGLETLFFAFFDLDLHADGVAGGEIGKVGPLELVGQLLHDGMDRHDGFLT